LGSLDTGAARVIGSALDLSCGAPVTFKDGEVPVFWACGITPQVVAMESKVPFMLMPKPGHMFITDLRDAEVAVI
jgi:uncharacterized protein YcsI (UPF0317 family)